LKKVSVRVAFRVKADPDWGIEEDILFGAALEKGCLLSLKFLSPEAARQEIEFVLAATPQEWKMILRKENKFLTDFMLGKITLDQGSKVGVLSIAPHANKLVDVLTQARLVFPDELAQQELAEYRTHQKEFRSQLGV
jgi:hypothetical protein